MTTTVTTAESGPLTANGTTALPFTFQAASASEVMVTRNGQVASPTSYTVALNADGTGTVLPSATWGSDTVNIYSDPDFNQPFQFERFVPLYPDQLNEPLDRLARGQIALRRRIASGGLDPNVDRAGKYLTFDAEGDPFAASGTGNDAALRTDLATDTGSLLIKHSAGGVGTYGRSMRQWNALGGMDAANVFNWIDDGLDDAIFSGSNVTPLDAYIQNAIEARYGANLRFVQTGYLITSGLDVLSKITIDFNARGATLVVGAPNIDVITIGDGTDPVRNATFGTKIIAPTFSPKDGVATSTSGAAIYRNYVAYCDIEGAQIYGRDTTTRRLFNAIRDHRVTESDVKDLLVQQVVNAGVHTSGDGTTPGRSVDVNYFNLRIIGMKKGFFIDEGCAGVLVAGFIGYDLDAAGAVVHIDTTPGPNGQNFFFTDIDFETSPAATAAIHLERGSGADFTGKWVGASMGYGLKVDSTFDTAKFTGVRFTQSRLLIEGPHVTISGGEVAGDNATPATTGIVIKAAHTKIGDDVEVRQWAGSGIGFGGATPSFVNIGALNMSSNGTDIDAPAGFTLESAPVIGQYSTDKAKTQVSAASMSFVPGFNKVTGAVPFATIALLGRGTRITVQVDASALTIPNSGNIVPKTGTSISVGAFRSVSLVCDGFANWHEV